jgi:hypothetical protein
MLMQGVLSVAAGASVNVLAGLLYEFCPVDARVDFYLVGDAAGEMRATVITGNDTVMPESAISRQARTPLVPDDFTFSDAVPRGQKITLQARNTGVGANSIFWRVDIRPLRR